MKQNLRLLLAAAMTLATAGSCGYYESYQEAKQVRTHADLQTITSTIEDLKAERGGNLQATSIEAAIAQVNEGRDAWGNAFRYRLREVDGSASYIVLSYGKDDRPDIADISDYFDVTPEVVAGELSRDIVFRDGVPLKNAGK